MSTTSQPTTPNNKKDLIRKLLKGIETGDPESVSVVNESKYIQHNPQTAEGGEGLAALFARISKSNPTVNLVRVFEDNEYVFAHTEYNFATRRIGFELFRFDENSKAVEHWDNIQPRINDDMMITGPTDATDLHLTESNRNFVQDFVKHILLTSKFDDIDKYVDKDLILHLPYIIKEENNNKKNGGLETYLSFLKTGKHKFDILHRVMAEGNFCLAVIEGYKNNNNEGNNSKVHTSFYNLFRIDDKNNGNKIVEIWDTIEEVPPKSEWKNNNGKF